MPHPEAVAFSAFASAFERPIPQSLPWDTLAEILTTHGAAPSKLACPAWSPCSFRPGEARSLASAVSLSCLVLDLDHVSGEAVAASLERLGDLEYVVHSTWSHRPGNISLRVVIPLSAEVPAHEWTAFYPSAVQALGFALSADPQCSDASRLYFGPFHPREAEAYAVAHRHHGRPLDPSSVPRSAPVARSGEAPRLPVTLAALERLAARWRRTTHLLADPLSLLVKGEPYAEPGHRDVITFQLCADLAKAFPDGDPDTLAALFAPSLSLMGPDAPDPGPKLRAAYAKLSDEAPAAPTETVTVSALGALAEVHGPLGKRWIIQKATAFWLLHAPSGKYRGPYTRDDAPGAIPRDLGPAIAAGVQLYRMDDKGRPVRKPLGDLVDEYGSVAEHVRASYSATVTRYDDTTRTLTEAPCPIRDVPPEYSAPVARWLELLFGARVHSGLSWLAALHDLSRPCAALLLTGPAGAGKSLLAHAAAGYWADAASDLEGAMASFSGDAFLACPLLFADEAFPRDNRGSHRTADLRRMVQEVSRPIRRKFLPDMPLEGCARIIIALNNENSLAFEGELSEDDLRAVSERILHIRVGQAAASYLADAIRMGWLPSDPVERRAVVIRHISWLRAHYKWEPIGRFLVTSAQDDELFRNLATREPIRAGVLRWVTGFLKAPELITRGNDKGWARVMRDTHTGAPTLWLNVQALEAYWEVYVPNSSRHVPRIGALASALASLSEARRPSADWKGQRIRYRVVDTEYLISWAEQAEFATGGEIRALLDRLADGRDLSRDLPQIPDGGGRVLPLTAFRNSGRG